MIVTLGDGRRTTIHVAEFALDQFSLQVVRLPDSMPLLSWCRESGTTNALVGGFYVRQPRVLTDPLHFGVPLGELRSGGEQLHSIAFDSPWHLRRACVQAVNGDVTIARRDELGTPEAGELLQAGPMLVREGRPAANEEEGFSAGSGQFDSDITAGRHPRAALGTDGRKLIAVATEGRTVEDAGMTLDELAATMIDLGAKSALNLDGGGSTSLVRGGRLLNVPREGDGTGIPGGRRIATALVFRPR